MRQEKGRMGQCAAVTKVTYHHYMALGQKVSFLHIHHFVVAWLFIDFYLVSSSFMRPLGNKSLG